MSTGTVGGRAEIRAAVPGGGFNQVSFAWRPAGTSDWQPLGTDDNPPYRVFQATTDLAKGTAVEYAVVVKDNGGHTSSAVTPAIGGDPPAPSGGGSNDPVTQPTNVSAAGDLNSEMGCRGDWQPDCGQAQLALDPTDKIWKGTYSLPAGSFSYKAAINKSWDENYGANAMKNGANISLTTTDAPVTFYYDHATHWITSDAQGPIITAPGDFQSELGCPGDWQPDCMRPWLQDPDGDGTSTFTTALLPAGSYNVKVAVGGTESGDNIGFTVGANQAVTFSYVASAKALTVTTKPAGQGVSTPDLTQAKAQWLQRGLVAWNLPTGAENCTYRLYWAAQGGLSIDAEARLGGPSIPLTFDPNGLPDKARERWPHLSGYDALRLSDKDARNKRLLAQILRGQVAVAAFDDTGALVDATGMQIPGVLDDLYSGAQQRTPGVTFGRGGPTFAVWAPTAQNVGLQVIPTGQTDPITVPMKGDDDGVWTRSGGRDWNGARYAFVVQVYAPSTGKVETNVVTDPYSVALTTNSQWSIAADLSASSLTPAG